MGTLTVKVITKYDKKENPGKDSFTSFYHFFFQANALAEKEIICGDNLFLVPTLRFHKLRRLLFDRKVSQVHSFLKRLRPEAYGCTGLFDGYFFLVSVFPLFFCFDEKALISKPYQNTLGHLNLARNG